MLWPVLFVVFDMGLFSVFLVKGGKRRDSSTIQQCERLGQKTDKSLFLLFTLYKQLVVITSIKTYFTV